jgi:hypothetical protein
MIFSYDKIEEIHGKAIGAGVHNKRNASLMGVNGDYVAGLDVASNPSDQLMSDLVAMNNIGGEVCGVPLERWLRNVAYQTRTQPDRHRFFRELADEAVKAVLPSLADIYQPIRDIFGIPELKAILIHDLKRDSTEFSLLRGQDESILCLLQEADQRAWARQLLEGLRSARPDDKDFIDRVAKALDALKQQPPRTLKIVLPPFDGCWWRETATTEAEAMATEFRHHVDDVRKDRGIPDLTDALFLRLTQETPSLGLGAEIVETANTILRNTLDSSFGKLIAADFESRHIDDAWSRVIVDAESKGPGTLVALFLAIFLKGGTLSGIADTNLRILLKIGESRNV